MKKRLSDMPERVLYFCHPSVNFADSSPIGELMRWSGYSSSSSFLYTSAAYSSFISRRVIPATLALIR